MPSHIAIWIDHEEARVFHVHHDHVDRETVLAPLHQLHHKHPRGAAEGKEHPNDAKHFFDDVSRCVEGAEEILVVGPSTAKLDFLRYLHQHNHTLESKIVGVESADHPTDGQLAAYAKQYFKRADRVR